MATAAERRAAQRKLAKQIGTVNYEPSKIGSKARKVANEYKADLVEKAVRHGVARISELSDYFSLDGLRKHLQAMSVNDLKEYLKLSADEIMAKASDSAASQAQSHGKSMSFIHKNYVASHYWYHGW